MSSLKTIPAIIPLNHIGCCIQFLQTYQNMHWLSYILKTGNFFNNKLVNFHFHFADIRWCCKHFLQIKTLMLQTFSSNKNREKVILWNSQHYWFLCNRYYIMHQIACTFFRIYPRMTPSYSFWCCDPELSPSPSKSLLRARVEISMKNKWSAAYFNNVLNFWPPYVFKVVRVAICFPPTTDR